MRGAGHMGYIKIKGARVIVWLKKGGSIRGRFVEVNDRRITIEGHPPISRKLVRTVTIDRSPPGEAS